MSSSQPQDSTPSWERGTRRPSLLPLDDCSRQTGDLSDHGKDIQRRCSPAMVRKKMAVSLLANNPVGRVMATAAALALLLPAGCCFQHGQDGLTWCHDGLHPCIRLAYGRLAASSGFGSHISQQGHLPSGENLSRPATPMGVGLKKMISTDSGNGLPQGRSAVAALVVAAHPRVRHAAVARPPDRQAGPQPPAPDSTARERHGWVRHRGSRPSPPYRCSRWRAHHWTGWHWRPR